MSDRISLEAIVSYFQKSKDEFISINFLPPNIEGPSTAVLICTCFLYAVNRGDNQSGSWHSPIEAQNKRRNRKDPASNCSHDMTLATFESLMLAFFYFSHLFEIFVAIGQGEGVLGGLSILLGEFLRSKEKVLKMQGVEAKRYIPLEVWGDEFEVMASGTGSTVASNWNNGEVVVTFQEFCQYAVRELCTPEEYLTHYKRKPWVERPEFPPMYNPLEGYSQTLAKCRRVTPQESVSVSVSVPQQEEEQSVDGDSKKIPPLQMHSSPKKILGGELSLVAEETSHDLGPALRPDYHSSFFMERNKLENDDSVAGESTSSSILFASRGRIRPTSAPPPHFSPSGHLLEEGLPAYRPLPPTVYNGRNIVTNKKALKKKYNQVHQYRLDPKMETNYTPRNFPKKIPQNRGLPKRLCTRITPQLSLGKLDQSSHPSLLPSHFSTVEGSRTTLHLQVPLQQSYFSIEEKPSVTADSTTMCDLSMN
eukprot:CAMPEP_0114415064 /NCGR_PEP_ID=MMETSP0103-20121206/1717_1 /TAXON_ID=37642 ORGANISM="Paraphysomonas imperforata, Strain PA2" /NCGR_SAMPLE_ID=MMETSP0103 /ASSEMBLY_ACC=CAM_ASM_000201 /LENGTH=477 /DNA_ID=CAMNT_0001583237 /DNA_START=170 /DNA_END=1603 /DNA_ORIENTATION=+